MWSGRAEKFSLILSLDDRAVPLCGHHGVAFGVKSLKKRLTGSERKPSPDESSFLTLRDHRQVKACGSPLEMTVTTRPILSLTAPASARRPTESLTHFSPHPKKMLKPKASRGEFDAENLMTRFGSKRGASRKVRPCRISKNLTPSAINKYREINQRQSAKRFNDERHQRTASRHLYRALRL